MKTTAAEHALELMLDFNDSIRKCSNTEEYVALVVGVLVFSKLVEENFSELYRKDAPESVNAALEELHLVAKSLANAAISQSNEKKKTDLTVN